MTNLLNRHPSDDQLWRYTDGDLSSQETAGLDEHLAACPRCRAEVDEFKQVLGDCQRYQRELAQTSPAPPPQPWCDIYDRFREADSAQERRRWSGGTGWRWLALAAAATVAWAVVDRIQQFGTPPSPEPPAISSPAQKTAQSLAQPPASKAERQTPPASAVESATPAEELKVFAALHRLGADLGEPIEIARSRNQILVTGVGIDPGLAQRLRDELRDVPRVQVRFSDPAAAVEPPIPASAEASLSGAAARFQQKLEKYLGGRAAFDRFADRALSTTEALMARAHALRRLDDRFPVEIEAALSPGDRDNLTQLRQDHAAKLRDYAVALEEQVRPALTSVGVPRATPSPPAAGIEALLEEARRTETFLAVLLGGATSEPMSEELPAQTQTSLARLRAEAESYARAIARQ